MSFNWKRGVLIGIVSFLSIKRVIAYPRERLKSQSVSGDFVIAIHNLLISSKFVTLRNESNSDK